MKFLVLFAPWQGNINFFFIKACTNLLTTLNLYTVTYGDHAPKYLQDFHCQIVSLNSPSPIQTTMNEVLPGKQFPLSNFLSYNQFSFPFQAFTASISSHTEPQTYAQVVLEPHWRASMQHELEALESNQTWIMTDLLSGKRPIDCK